MVSVTTLVKSYLYRNLSRAFKDFFNESSERQYILTKNPKKNTKTKNGGSVVGLGFWVGPPPPSWEVKVIL